MLGTKYLQDKNIQDRDIYPDNILIFEKPIGFLNFKICDPEAKDIVFPSIKRKKPRKCS